MTIRDDRRAAALERMADHLLREGLSGASLRSLAAAAGTSNRMLLYYFRDKDELLGAVLDLLAARLQERLEAATAAAVRPYGALIAELWAAVRTDALRPYLQLWLELAAAAGRGEEPHRAAAARIADGFLAWVGGRLLADSEADRSAQAALLLATLDGLAMLVAAGHAEAADRALQAASADGGISAEADAAARRSSGPKRTRPATGEEQA